MNSQPKIAVVGASRHRHKFGNKCVRAYQTAGWRVFPVNPGTAEVEGETAYPAIESLPEDVDRISLYTPPARTRSLLPRLPGGVEVFFNPGTSDATILAEAERLGVEVRNRCAIVDIGLSPSQFGAQDTE